MNYVEQFPQLANALKKADHIDVKSIDGRVNLRAFIAAMMSYQPGWITFLYRVRAVFVRFLGMRQEGIPRASRMRAEDVPMTPGARVAVFTVEQAEENRYWVAVADDSHLKAVLCVVMKPLEGDLNRFHVLTIVHYHRWTGPVYFNVIRPFHHLVVGNMVKAGVQHA